MLGKRRSPNLGCKAAEGLGLLDFAIESLETHAAKLPIVAKDLLLGSARAAQRVTQIINESKRVMSPAVQQELLSQHLRHMMLFERAGGALLPKHHLMIHCIQRISMFGNPRYYHTFRDESLNCVIAKSARSCHRRNFAANVHLKWDILQDLKIPYGAG